MKRVLSTLAVALGCAAAQAQPAAPLKIGFISTMSGPSAILGQDTLDGFNLGMQSVGGTLGGRTVELVLGDDQLKPDVARQLADKMVERDRVEFITGTIWSNVLLAIAKPVLDAGVFLVSPNAGPSQLAGAQCHPQFFATGFQNDTPNEAMGIYMQKKGYTNVYLMAPNYPAGRDMLAGFKRYFKGNVSAEVYTTLGQLDYAAELAQLRAKKPSSLYFFISGGPGMNFVKQYAQAGLSKDVPMFAPSFSIDQTAIPAIGDAAVGATVSTFWSPDLDSALNRKFVADFEAKYKRTPSPYAAQAFDTARIIDAALKASGGTKDKAAFRKAMENVKFDSVRGNFKFAPNHFPIQDFYLAEVVKNDKGQVLWKTRELITRDHADSYVSRCSMPQ
ncbi:MAG: ABC transporter substrate-binding protein [Burkholderiales bacterium]|nr:ABC transporter substrate-binding protein [Burkholderiales bacterium]